MNINHPALSQIEVRHQLGRAEAEQFLRGLSANDPAAKKAVEEIDQARADLKAAAVAENEAHAAALELSMDQVRDLVGKLAANRDLYTWLSSRVHVTLAHDRQLSHDE